MSPVNQEKLRWSKWNCVQLTITYRHGQTCLPLAKWPEASNYHGPVNPFNFIQKSEACVVSAPHSLVTLVTRNYKWSRSIGPSWFSGFPSSTTYHLVVAHMIYCNRQPIFGISQKQALITRWKKEPRGSFPGFTFVTTSGDAKWQINHHGNG